MAIRKRLRVLAACRRGATAIEYGLICGLIVIAMIVGLQSLAGGSSSMWGRVQTNVGAVM
ncbi:MAG: Flp family type IVb pilin [Sphingomicrobium sp.]